jgi:hypothetical protein
MLLNRDCSTNKSAKRSTSPSWLAAVPLILKAVTVSLVLAVADAEARTHEATAFSVSAGSPDEYMQAGAEFARSLDPKFEITFWDSQIGSLSVSRVEGDGVKCIVRASPGIGDALKPLGRFLDGRILNRPPRLKGSRADAVPSLGRGAFMCRLLLTLHAAGRTARDVSICADGGQGSVVLLEAI